MTMMSTSRRAFLTGGFRGTASAAVAGSAWTAWVQETRAAPLVIRPPGALEQEDAFQAACIKCGECVQACPYNTLRLADLAQDAPLGTPFMQARKTPCEMCEDIPCVRNCPTGALNRELQEIRDARMGVAVVDSASCLSMQGLRCEACHRACPLIDEALRLTYEHQPQTGKHAFFRPTVDPEVCTGCGKCEHACVTEVAAIRVLPRSVAQGKIGTHYRLREFVPTNTEEGPKLVDPGTNSETKAPTLDYLNSEVDI